MNLDYAPLIELTRGGITESVHFGAFCVITSRGEVLASHGNPNLVCYPRSSEKPFQALPFLEINGDRHYDLSSSEVAILCGSHSGSEMHMKVISELQHKTGIHEADLLCGVHPLSGQTAASGLTEINAAPTQNRNNCSGKHTGMLAHATLRGYSREDYINPDHPLQHVILDSFAEMCEINKQDVVTGIDGCSAPNYAVPLNRFALAFARLIDPWNLPRARADACRRITGAMTSEPIMISGPNRFDTTIMELGKARLVSKAGAEGYQAIGLFPGVLSKGSPGIGIALKVADGDTTDYQTAMHAQFDGDEPFHLATAQLHERARPCAVVELLRQLGGFDDEFLAALSHLAARPIYNWRKLTIGEIRPAFHLSR
jgi:L-asparaginase II